MTPEEKLALDLAHLQNVVANQADRIARLERDLANERMGHHVMRGLWEREVPPGWRCWRIKRRAMAREEARRGVG